ncbi:MAG: phosphoglycerate dehydrogenase [Acidobacteria bacterium]|nr:phosphoglycerate dehydrogenase [Acidobacteriota bacterium]
MKVLVAEPLADGAIQLLRDAPGCEVVVSSPKEYGAHLADCEALVVRSAVKVNKDVLAQAPKLRVIGRAGVGVDNVDMDAATAAGVLVMNTPGGNAVSVAEHTLAFMLSLARAIPQASASTKSGKWEKKKFLGNELRGKTLGVVGLGAIGREVVRRAKAFEMRVLGHDPYVSPHIAADLGVELVELDTLYSSCDFLSLHVGVTAETRHMINAAALGKMKPGVRIVNCARGELIDQAALLAALESGRVAGAALDVFDKEPPAEGDPILQPVNLLATPHIGGSTEEAQEIVGVRIVQQMIEYLTSGVAINAVNMPSLSPDQYKAVGPWLDTAERLGTFASYLASGNPTGVRICYRGRLANYNTQLIRNSAVAGVLNRSLQQRANMVNSWSIAKERGLVVTESHERDLPDSVRVELSTAKGTVGIEGSLVLGKPRLTLVDGIPLEAALTGHLTVMRNRDVPGVIGHIGTVLGANSINIANFSLGRKEHPDSDGVIAISVVETDDPVPENVLAELKKHPAVLAARVVELSV